MKKPSPTVYSTIFFLDELFNTQYQSEERFYSVFRIMTSLAILIAALGLYSLASFTVSQKTKEIGIRKVLGASVAQVFGLLSNDFIKLIAIAVVIAIPVAYLSVNQWLDSFPYRIDVYWWLLVLPIVFDCHNCGNFYKHRITEGCTSKSGGSIKI